MDIAPLPVDVPNIARTMPRAQASTPAEAERLGREFEHMFLSQMLAQMFSGLEAKGPFGGGFGEDMFRSLQVDEFARGLVARGGVGVAQSVAREMIRLQENARG